MKTSELTGPALDWAVAKCEGARECELFDQYTHVWLSQKRYSTDWAQGGPIIEREDICLTSWYERWDACASHGRTAARRISGPAPLVAAMRCFVSSRLGDEVDIPQELCNQEGETAC